MLISGAVWLFSDRFVEPFCHWDHFFDPVVKIKVKMYCPTPKYDDKEISNGSRVWLSGIPVNFFQNDAQNKKLCVAMYPSKNPDRALVLLITRR